jgi:hypothetical protein
MVVMVLGSTMEVRLVVYLNALLGIVVRFSGKVTEVSPSMLRNASSPIVVSGELGANTTLVMVPSPARYALHKLLVSQTRSVTQQTKSGKDLHQAALLLEALAEDRPEDLEIAAAAFAESGPAVAKKALRGLAAAIRRWPECATARELLQPVLESAS